MDLQTFVPWIQVSDSPAVLYVPICAHTHTLAAHIHTYTYTQTQKCGSGYLCLWLRGLHVLRVQGPDRSIDEDAEFEVKH